MKLELERIVLKNTYTIGELYIDEEYECDTLEDRVRPDGVKVFGETAIPEGTYKVIITFSKRFQRDLPLLLDVPMFNGIRIHFGNTAADTKGCILVGINNVKGKVTQSKVTFEKLFEKLKDQEDIEITITHI